MKNNYKNHVDHSFYDESLKYFKRNYDGKDITKLPPHIILTTSLNESKIPFKSSKVLEIGCGAGNNLAWLKKENNCLCSGTEPSSKVIEYLKASFPEIDFYCATADNLPFENNFFDLVILRSVLHWVDRNFILQSIGEALRVTSKWLIISDFYPTSPFRVKYKHKKGLFTYHIDYSKMLLETGIVNKVHELVTIPKIEDGEIKLKIIDNSDLNNPSYDYDRVKTTIFEKDIYSTPLISEDNSIK